MYNASRGLLYTAPPGADDEAANRADAADDVDTPEVEPETETERERDATVPPADD